MDSSVFRCFGSLLFAFAAVLYVRGSGHSEPYPWPHNRSDDSIVGRIQPPKGFKRIQVSTESFGYWLRGLPLKPGRPPVLLFNGGQKSNQSAHLAVCDIDVGNEDLQQCADAVIRLRAEYLFAQGRGEDICFRFTSGDKSDWLAWEKGLRPKTVGNNVKWVQRAKEDGSYASFRRYLTTTYRWAGTASLDKELVPVRDSRRVEPGDVFIRGGFPGHAVLVVDVAKNDGGERVFLLAQSYMPAQEIHVLKNPNDPLSPWYSAEDSGDLNTPEWVFSRKSLKRFSETGCP